MSDSLILPLANALCDVDTDTFLRDPDARRAAAEAAAAQRPARTPRGHGLGFATGDRHCGRTFVSRSEIVDLW
jgi:hypothetical protein